MTDIPHTGTAGGAQSTTPNYDSNIPAPFPRRPRTGAARASAPASTRARRGTSALGVLVPGISLPTHMSGYRPQDVGLLTHATLAVVAPALHTIPSDRLAEYVLDVTGGLVNGENVNRRRTLQQTAAGHVCTYLRRIAPASPWRVLQAEFQTGMGRTDLAWKNAETDELFFDEIKTHKGALSSLSEGVFEQARRQANGGENEFSDLFIGVRVIPCGSLHLTSMVTAAGERVALDPTPEEPFRLRDDSMGGAA